MQLSFDFSKPEPVLPADSSNDYHHLPVSEKQLHYARSIALRTGQRIPNETLNDRVKLSAWIDAQKAAPASRFSQYPSSKQVAFAERIARIKRRAVPDECFKDRKMMSRWIDSNR